MILLYILIMIAWKLFDIKSKYFSCSKSITTIFLNETSLEDLEQL